LIFACRNLLRKDKAARNQLIQIREQLLRKAGGG
jgi:hypothetical protein